jgi:hypothetical protein
MQKEKDQRICAECLKSFDFEDLTHAGDEIFCLKCYDKLESPNIAEQVWDLQNSVERKDQEFSDLAKREEIAWAYEERNRED